MQLVLDAADRLVELVEERRGPVPAEEAARSLFALAHAPLGLARTLLDDVVGADARLTWHGSAVGLARRSGVDLPLDAATYVVVDLETTGLRPGAARICEIGAVRLRGLEPAGCFHTFADPGLPLPRAVAGLTGLADADLHDAPSGTEAVRRFLAFSSGVAPGGAAPGRAWGGVVGDPSAGVGWWEPGTAEPCRSSVFVAHNARFDLAFLDREVERLSGRRIAAPVVDTVWLARRLLGTRSPRAGLAALAHFFGTSVTPCHRALPDAQATAEILVALIGLAQERGARTVDDLCRLSAPRARRVYGKRALAHGAPPRPGVYLFRDRNEQVLYVGRARDLRARLRSYFRSDRQRPAVEAALAAVERIEWRVLGSELEAALEELRLIRELRPPANARGGRPDRSVYLHRRGESVSVSRTPGPLGPIRSRRRLELAARALRHASAAELDRLTGGGPLPRLRTRLRDLSESLRYEEAARLRDQLAALEAVVRDLAALERLRVAQLCLLAPAVEEDFRRAFFVSGGRIAAVRTIPTGGGGELELAAGLAQARAAGPSYAAEDAEELLLVASYLRRPPPELEIIDLSSPSQDEHRPLGRAERRVDGVLGCARILRIQTRPASLPRTTHRTPSARVHSESDS